MLTGHETLAAVAAATGHRHGPATAVGDVDGAGVRGATTWAELLGRVRHLALGLAAEDPTGGVLALPPGAPAADRAVVLLAAAATGRVVAVAGPAGADDDGVAEVPDLAALAAAGARLDAEQPGRYEALVAGQAPGAPLVRGAGLVHSHASLLVAARSLAQGAGLGADDRLLVALGPGVAQLVASLVVPCLTATPAWSFAPGTPLAVGVAAVSPSLVLASGPVPARPSGTTAPGPLRRRLVARAARRAPVEACRLVHVVDASACPPAPGPIPAGAALALDAAGGLVSAFGPPGSLGRPLPGVSLAIDDDGQVLVRTRGGAPDVPGRRSDGWVPAGLHGRLEGGALHPEPAPSTVATP